MSSIWLRRVAGRDPDGTAIVLDQLRREGITIHDGVAVERVTQGANIRMAGLIWLAPRRADRQRKPPPHRNRTAP